MIGEIETLTEGTTRQRSTAITRAQEPTVKKGRVNPPIVYKNEPSAGPEWQNITLHLSLNIENRKMKKKPNEFKGYPTNFGSAANHKIWLKVSPF